MIKRVALIFAALCFPQGIAITQPPPASAKCLPLGRLESSSGQQVSTRIVCQGERPKLSAGKHYNFLCYATGNFLNSLGTGGWNLPGCPPPSARRIPCPTNSKVKCEPHKGPGEDPNAPVLITPYGNTLIDDRPLISWTPVPGATSYVVKVSGPGVRWGKLISQGTTLAYPSDEPPLGFGNVYTMRVSANRGKAPISSVKVFNLVSEQEATRLVSAVQLIEAWNIPEDETAYDTNAVYAAKYLLHNAIETLQARVKAGSQTPDIYQELGDRYLEIGWPEAAQVQYKRAKQLAQQIRDPTAVSEAEAGLQQIAQLKASSQQE